MYPFMVFTDRGGCKINGVTNPEIILKDPLGHYPYSISGAVHGA